jgi:hypothetical protein
MMTRRKYVWQVLLTVGLSGCRGQRFRVIKEPKKLTVDCQQLGEYPSTVTRIILREKNGRVVWDVDQASGTPQLHKIVVNAGVNSGELDGVSAGKFKNLQPVGGFELISDRVYEIEVRGDGGKVCAKEEFSFR